MKLWYRFSFLAEEVDFNRAKLIFLESCNFFFFSDHNFSSTHIYFRTKLVGLPENFDFSKYLRKALSNTVQHTVEIMVTTWVVLGVVLLILMGIYDYVNEEAEHGVWVFVGLGWLLFLIQVAGILELWHVKRVFLRLKSEEEMIQHFKVEVDEPSKSPVIRHMAVSDMSKLDARGSIKTNAFRIPKK